MKLPGKFVVTMAVISVFGYAQNAAPISPSYDVAPVLIGGDSGTQFIQKVLDHAPSNDLPEASIVVSLRVDVHGRPFHVMVLHGTGMATDEKAVELVRQDRFIPATKSGVPVVATIYLKITSTAGSSSL